PKWSPVMKSVTVPFWANPKSLRTDHHPSSYALNRIHLWNLRDGAHHHPPPSSVAQRYLSSAATTGRTPGCCPLQRRVRRPVSDGEFVRLWMVERQSQVGMPQSYNCQQQASGKAT